MVASAIANAGPLGGVRAKPTTNQSSTIDSVDRSRGDDRRRVPGRNDPIRSFACLECVPIIGASSTMNASGNSAVTRLSSGPNIRPGRMEAVSIYRLSPIRPRLDRLQSRRSRRMRPSSVVKAIRKYACDDFGLCKRRASRLCLAERHHLRGTARRL